MVRKWIFGFLVIGILMVLVGTACATSIVGSPVEKVLPPKVTGVAELNSGGTTSAQVSSELSVDATGAPNRDKKIDLPKAVIAFTEYYYMDNHAVNSVFETPTSLASDVYRGWGHEVTFRDNAGSWVDMPAGTPSASNIKARYIYARVYLGTGTKVTKMDIYDGSTKIKSQTLTVTGTGAYKWLSVDLGAYRAWSNGLNIVLYVKGDSPTTANNKFVAVSSGAYWKHDY